MGWAKYTEDNFEIMQERQNLMKEQRPIIKVYPSVIKPAAEPVRKQSVEYENRYLTCVGCGKIILFSPRDQIFFAEKGWNKPKRCKSCRELRRKSFIY